MILFGAVLFGLLVTDLVTKWLTMDMSARDLIGGFLSITPTMNAGVAFSWFYGAGVVLTVVTGLLICGIVAFFIIFRRKMKTKPMLFDIGFAFFIAGAFGNWFCRVFYNNAVRDFIRFHFFPFIFNFADVWLTTGAILLGTYFVFFYKPNGNVADDGKVADESA